MKKRIIAMFLVVAMAASLLMGCGGESKTPSVSTASNDETKTAPQKQYTISVFSTRITPEPGSEVMQKIQEKLGQKLEITAVADADYASRLNIFIASNDMPDIYGSSNLEAALKAAATITEDEVKQYMPSSYAVAMKRFTQLGYNKDSVFNNWSIDGKLKAFSNGEINSTYPYGVIIRKDLLDELGQKTPTTIADWDVLLKAYKAKYPNKYPISGRGKDNVSQCFYLFYSAYGVSFNNWLLKDNKLVYGPFMPEMKEAITQLQKWYKAGYINPEWFTMDGTALNNEFINGNMIYNQYYSLMYNGSAPFTPGSVPDQTLAKNPNAKFEWAPFPKWKDGVKPLVTNYNLVVAPTCFGGKLQADKDKLHTVMNTWDRIFNDKEINLLSKYGIEGKHYDYVDGVITAKKEYSTNDAKQKDGFGWPFAGAFDPSDEIRNLIVTKQAQQNIEKMVNTPDGIYGKNNVDYGFNRVTGKLASPSGEDLDVKSKSKKDQWSSMFVGLIIGEKSLTDFDKFIVEWKKEVGDEMTEAANRLYLKQWQK